MTSKVSKAYIITGATSGMGRQVAIDLGKEGAGIIVSGRDRERGAAVEDEIRKAGGQAIFIAGDVTDVDYNKQLVQSALEEFGRLEGLVSNAGMLGLDALTELSESRWHQTIATNLDAVFYLLKYAIPVMQKQGAGAVVINASIAAWKSFPNHPAYCASKAGVVALARQAAVEYGPAIRINTICPGPVDTPLIWASAAAFPNPDEAVQDAARSTLMQRLGTPGDVSNLVRFLLSENAAWITGAVYTIDGGITARG